jgi:serine/threonine protein kinase
MEREVIPFADEIGGDETQPSRFVGRYRLIREIAAGGMASVHLASAESQEGFSKLVAIKLIHDHLARDPSFVDMFLDEARIAARIEHANVCTVFDFGQTDGTYFIAMEYLVGETFGHVRDAVRKRGPDTRWPLIAASLVMQACEGLHAAHELTGEGGRAIGLVHRDVSPHNLFLTYGGVVKVVDFGIARAEGRSHHTTPGTLKGKFAYMAPEQLTGGDDIDRRVDVWALGVTLWELLTLRPLFKKNTAAETLSRVLGEEIRPPSEIAGHVPHELDAIVLRALSRSPEHRYPNARAFGRDLAKFCRAHEGPLGHIELEEWMSDLAPESRRGKLSLAALAREQTQMRASRSVVTSIPPALLTGETTPSHGASASKLVSESGVMARGSEGTLVGTAPSREGERLRTAGKVAIVALSVGLGAAFAAFSGSSSAPTPRTERPAPRVELRSDEPTRVAVPVAPAAPALPDPASLAEPREPEPARRGDSAMAAMREAPPARREADEAPPIAARETVPEPAAPTVAETIAAPAPTPVPAPPPAAVIPTTTAPQPIAAVPRAPAPAPAPTFEAQVAFRGLAVRGSLPSTSVRATLDRALGQLRACYASSARAAGRDAPADVGVRFAIDENGAVRNVSADGGGGALTSCVQGVVTRLRPRERPDIGFIQVSLTVHFTPVRGAP